MKQTLLILGFFLSSITLNAQSDLDSITSSKNNDEREELEYVVPSQENVDISIMTPPEGFKVSPAFNGYIDINNGSGIIISLLTNINFLKLDEGMNDEYFSKNKLKLVEKNRIVTDENVKGIQYKLSFTLKEVEFVRELIYLGNLKSTLWLNITYPKMVEELMADEILKSIKSVKFKQIKDEEN